MVIEERARFLRIRISFFLCVTGGSLIDVMDVGTVQRGTILYSPIILEKRGRNQEKP